MKSSLLSDHLKENFGLSEFRAGQEEIILALLRGQDAIGVLPTGSGKSLIYQFLASFTNGHILVVSPLIALMSDQLQELKRFKIAGAVFHSGLTSREREDISRKWKKGELSLLFISPEGLINQLQKLFRPRQPDAIFIDEAHCYDLWGRNFRPAYRRLKRLKVLFQNIPLALLSATLTKSQIDEICHSFKIKEGLVYREERIRDNLSLSLQLSLDLKKLKTRCRRGAGIIYCQTRKECHLLADFLRDKDPIVYHAGLSRFEREHRSQQFKIEKKPLVIATEAFGMGINRSDLRFIIHYRMPKSFHHYAQEIGRGGRDGRRTECTLFWSWSDYFRVRKYFLEGVTSELQFRQLIELDEMFCYCHSFTCRQYDLSNHYSLGYKERCGHCDNCKARWWAQFFKGPLWLMSRFILGWDRLNYGIWKRTNRKL